jgi:hypothetical protein
VLRGIPAVIELHATRSALVQFGSYDALRMQKRVFGEPESMIALFQRHVSVAAVRALSGAAEPESNRTRHKLAAAATTALVHLAVDPLFPTSSMYALHGL